MGWYTGSWGRLGRRAEGEVSTAVDRGGLKGTEGTLKKGLESFGKGIVKNGVRRRTQHLLRGLCTPRALDYVLFPKPF